MYEVIKSQDNHKKAKVIHSSTRRQKVAPDAPKEATEAQNIQLLNPVFIVQGIETISGE